MFALRSCPERLSVQFWTNRAATPSIPRLPCPAPMILRSRSSQFLPRLTVFIATRVQPTRQQLKPLTASCCNGWKVADGCRQDRRLRGSMTRLGRSPSCAATRLRWRLISRLARLVEAAGELCTIRQVNPCPSAARIPWASNAGLDGMIEIPGSGNSSEAVADDAAKPQRQTIGDHPGTKGQGLFKDIGTGRGVPRRDVDQSGLGYGPNPCDLLSFPPRPAHLRAIIPLIARSAISSVAIGPQAGEVSLA